VIDAVRDAGRRIVIILLRDDACRCRGRRDADPMIPICDD
jgi:hypothetical protein